MRENDRFCRQCGHAAGASPNGPPNSSFQNPAPARLTRLGYNRRIAGVCSGLAQFLGVDPTLVRLLTVVALFLSCGWALLLYIAAWIIVPLEWSTTRVAGNASPGNAPA